MSRTLVIVSTQNSANFAQHFWICTCKLENSCFSTLYSNFVESFYPFKVNFWYSFLRKIVETEIWPWKNNKCLLPCNWICPPSSPILFWIFYHGRVDLILWLVYSLEDSRQGSTTTLISQPDWTYSFRIDRLYYSIYVALHDF